MKRPQWYNQSLGGNWFKKKTRSKKSRDTVPLISLFATGVADTGGKFAAGVVDTGGNLPPVSTTLLKLVAKFAAGVVDTGGQPGAANISATFGKNSKRP